ncbi:MAG: hypothetical protein QXD13_00775, partial [Candidatus Pacearchaeota archaeon]
LLYIKARILGEVAKKACKDVKCVNGEKMKAEGAAAGAATKEGGVQYFFNTAGEQAWVFYNGQGYVFDSEKLEWREGNALISDTKHSWWVPKAENVVNPEFPFVPNKFFVYTLSENYNPLKIIKIQKNGEDTRIWMFESKIYYGYSLTYEDLQIGTITNNKINLLPGAEKNGNVKEYYSDLNGASISGTAITPAAA